MTKPKLITILYNKPGDLTGSEELSEADIDTWDSVSEIHDELNKSGISVQTLSITKQTISKTVKQIRGDMVYNLVEWTGVDAIYCYKLIKLLEKYNILYTGSNEYGLRVSNDKTIMKELMSVYKIPTPKFQLIEDWTSGFRLRTDFKYPVIVKPTLEHCGIGISQKSVVSNENDAIKLVQELGEKFMQAILVEEYIEGRELHITIIEKEGQPVVLPAAEIVFHSHGGLPMFTYDAKWMDESDEFKGVEVILAELTESVQNRIKNIGIQMFNYFGARDLTRLDLRLRGEEIFVLEINNNPAVDFTPIGDTRISAEAVGLDYMKFMNRLVSNAFLRREVIYDTIEA